MADRKSRSVNFDTDHLEWMDRNIGNRSEFINDLITKYREGGAEMNEAVARFRREQLRSQKASLETRLESVESELESVNGTLTTQEEQREDAFQKAERLFHDDLLELDDLHTGHKAIQNHAENADMPVSEFVEEMKERLGVDE